MAGHGNGRIAAMVAGAGILAALLTPQARAGEPADPRNKMPAGWVDFCHRGSPLCQPHQARSEVLTDARERELASVLEGARHLRFVPEDRFGAPGQDIWRYPADGTGDCEDAVIWMMTELTARHGWPRGALTMAVVEHWSGTFHVVLLAHTDRGAFVLDILRRSVRPAAESGARWVAIQRPGLPYAWNAPYPTGPDDEIRTAGEDADAQPSS